MLYLQIEPQEVEPFKDYLLANDWDIVSQDGGQSQFIGWAYIMHLSKTLDGKLAETWLHFSENQGVQEAHIELNVPAKTELTNLLTAYLATKK